MVTIDAAGCQTAIVQALRAGRADYVLAVKRHQQTLYRPLDVQFREDACRIRTGHAPAVMSVLRRTALNMLCTIQQKLETDGSIGLLRDRIGRQTLGSGRRPALNPTLRLPWPPTQAVCAIPVKCCMPIRRNLKKAPFYPRGA